MPVDRNVTLAIIRKELAAARHLGRHHGWVFSDLDEEKPGFTVKLVSPVDDEEYHVEFQLDDYKELPPFIEFFIPATPEQAGERGTKRCYPRDQRSGNEGSIFHEAPCICHQSSRKAYQRGGPHQDWMPQISNWVTHAGGLTTLADILQMIQARISDPATYKGRMAK